MNAMARGVLLALLIGSNLLVSDVEAQGAPSKETPSMDAVFSEVQVIPAMIESTKEIIRQRVPGSHVRRIISGADVDSTLMVMVHPKGNFRAFINDFYRAIDTLPGLVKSRTYIGTTTHTPEQFPINVLLGWRFVKFEKNPDRLQVQALSVDVTAEPQVLEVARISGDFDLVIVYKWDGSTVQNYDAIRARLDSRMRSGPPIQIVVDHGCP